MPVLVNSAAAAALRIVAVYLIAGSLWILFSDYILELLVHDRLLMSRIALLKGWMFIGITSVMLYQLIKRHLDRQKNLLQELRLSRATIECAADEIFWTDHQGRIVFANQSAIKTLGYSQDELKQMTVHDLAPFFPAEAWPNHWQELQNKGSIRFETVQRNKDGSTMDIEVSTNHIRHDNYEYTAAFVRDICDRKQAQSALLAAEARFRGLLESVHLAAVMLDRDCRITFCNGFLLELTGWTREEILGRNWFETFIPIDERKKVQQVNDSILSKTLVPNFENHILAKDGRRFLIVWNNTTLYNPDGSISGTASIGVDVTLHRHLEQEQRQMELQAQQHQKLESLGVMAGGIAHDFNNILSVIMGNTELALHRLGTGRPINEYLEKIQQSARKAAEISQQILMYTGKGVFITKPIDIAELLKTIHTMLKASLPRNIVLQASLSATVPTIEADLFQIRQVICNLVENASEAIGDRDGIITIATGTLTCSQVERMDYWPPEGQLSAGAYVFIDVIDTGCGIGKDEIDRIFEPFFTTKFIGRGLGMATALGIIRGHKGGIKVTSTLGKGSTFRIVFPVSDDSQQQ